MATQTMRIKNGCVRLDSVFILEHRKWLLELQVADVRFKIVVPDPSDPSENEIQLLSVLDPYKSSHCLPAVRTAQRKKFNSLARATTTIVIPKRLPLRKGFEEPKSLRVSKR